MKHQLKTPHSYKKNSNILEELQYSPKNESYSSTGIPLKVNTGRNSRNKKNMFEDDISTKDKNESISSFQRAHGIFFQKK